MITRRKLGVAVGLSVLTAGAIYQHASYINEHSFHLNPGVYAEANKVLDLHQARVKSNALYLAEIDNRNTAVATLVVDEGTLTSNTVAFGGLRTAGYSYADETSTDIVIDGIENLDDKYGVYFYSEGKRNSLTPELMYVLETECAKWDLDPYVMVGIIMTESRGNANAKNPSSTATGLCQMLRGTATTVYEDWLGHGKGTYNHSMAYNPELSIRMGCTYLGRLAKQKGLYRAIQNYRGRKDISGYCASINKYMGMSGKHLPF